MIGEVTETGRLEMTWHGETVVDIPPGTAADEGPVYQRPLARPDRQDALAADDPAALPRPAVPAALRDTLLRCSPRPTWPTRPGSPSSTTATCAATPCWPCPRTAA